MEGNTGIFMALNLAHQSCASTDFEQSITMPFIQVLEVGQQAALAAKKLILS
jgi:hypothetical protein